jgi:hypothetical protein
MRAKAKTLFALTPILSLVLLTPPTGVPRTAAPSQLGHVHSPQSSVVGTPRTRPAALPIIVDGGTTPEAIPDELAYHHFIMAIAIPDNPSLVEVSRRNGLLDAVGLSKSDNASLIGALAHVREGLNTVSAMRAQSPIDPAALKLKEDGIILTARERIWASVTADGFERLTNHIRGHVKTRIKIYGDVAR